MNFFLETNVNRISKSISIYLSVFLLTISGLSLAESNDPEKIYGKVIETLDAGNYTYVHVDSGEEKYWAATPPVSLETGSMVAFIPNMPMKNFASKTLDRTFDLVYFVGQIITDQSDAHAGGTEINQNASTNNAESFNVDNIKKAANGLTIDETLTGKQKLAGETIQIRGMVVKYTPKVMGKNWIHIRDSSSATDLVVTTSGAVEKGDVILVSGKLQLDRDFGYGYIYDVLLEDSTVTVE